MYSIMIMETHEFRGLRALAASHIEWTLREPSHCGWRHHGIGVLQSYLIENADPEIRLHVWDPSLVRPGIEQAGDVHDHRFELVSQVLEGVLHETIFHEVQESPLRCDVWTVENARSAGAAQAFDGKHAFVGSACFVADHRKHPRGARYGLGRGLFHRTQAPGLAVTICAMHDKRGQARLLTPQGREPVHAFSADWSVPIEQREAVLRQAVQALRSPLRSPL
jgi:hypothetical protein